jgi:hypothetical protein
MNLHHDGLHMVADTIAVKARATKEMQIVWVAGCGMVTIASTRKSWRRSNPPPDHTLVGAYKPSATCKDIREDLAERLKEIQ